MSCGAPTHGRDQPDTDGSVHRTNSATNTAGIDHRGVAVASAQEHIRARRDLRWTLATADCGAGFSTPTLTNEADFRRCSPSNLIKRCWAMAILPPDLLDELSQFFNTPAHLRLGRTLRRACAEVEP